jgi:uncharacterized membrane protein
MFSDKKTSVFYVKTGIFLCAVINFHVKSLISELATVCSVILSMNSQRKSIKSHTKPTQHTNTNISIILLVLFAILMIFFVLCSLLNQQITQFPAMKAVISHESF